MAYSGDGTVSDGCLTKFEAELAGTRENTLSQLALLIQILYFCEIKPKVVTLHQTIDARNLWTYCLRLFWDNGSLLDLIRQAHHCAPYAEVIQEGCSAAIGLKRDLISHGTRPRYSKDCSGILYHHIQFILADTDWLFAILMQLADKLKTKTYKKDLLAQYPSITNPSSPYLDQMDQLKAQKIKSEIPYHQETITRFLRFYFRYLFIDSLSNELSFLKILDVDAFWAEADRVKSVLDFHSALHPITEEQFAKWTPNF